MRRIAIGIAVEIILASVVAAASARSETPGDTIAAQIRRQGYLCRSPVIAVRDRQASKPNEAVWILRCKNASYRVRLTPDMAAQVTDIR